MAANDILYDAQLRHAIGVRRLASGDVARIVALLVKSDSELEAKLLKRLRQGDFTSKRFRALMRDVALARKNVFKEILTTTRDDLIELAKAEQGFTAGLLNEALPVQLEYAAVSAVQLRAIVTSMPFSATPGSARTLSQWWSGVAAADKRRITEAIQLGMVQGEDVPTMVRRVVEGTDLTRRNAEAVVRTGVNHVSNRARDAFFAEQDDLVRALRWVATLDGRTTLICAGRDGHFAPVSGTSFKGVPRPWLRPALARPPAHTSCRSIMAAVLEALGLAARLPDRPFVRDTRTRRRRQMDFRAEAREAAGARWKRMTVKQRNAAIRRQKVAWSKDAVGTIPGETTYDAWLRRQSTAFQNETLGIGKARAFRNGLKLDKYVDRTGNELTLVELKQKFPEFVTGVQ